MRSITCSLLVSTLVLASHASTQCTVTNVKFQSYGTGCTSVFNAAPVLAGKFDSQNCDVLLDLAAYGGCCNTFLRQRIFVFGARQTQVPLPFLGPKCVQLASLDLLVALPTSSGSTLRINLPPGIGSGTVYAQGAAKYFTTIGLYDNFQLSGGLTITIQ